MPACTTPLLCPVWWAATRVSLSSTVTGSPGASINNCRATANPTIPAPTTTTLIRHHRVPTRRGLSHSCDAPSLLFALALHRPHRQGCHTSLGTGRPCSCAVFLPETRWVDRVPTLPEQPTEESDLEHYGGRSGGGWSRDCRRPHHGRRTKRRCAVLGRLRGTGRAHPSDHVVMCGPDGIGARIAEQLTRAGESMVVLFEFAGPAHAAIIQGQSVTVVDPIGGVAQTLNAAGIDRAKAVICGWTASPACAALSAAPGSPVTYRPGMPSAPPAAVMSISEM